MKSNHQDRPASEEEQSDGGEGVPVPPPVIPIQIIVRTYHLTAEELESLLS